MYIKTFLNLKSVLTLKGMNEDLKFENEKFEKLIFHFIFPRTG